MFGYARLLIFLVRELGWITCLSKQIVELAKQGASQLGVSCYCPLFICFSVSLSLSLLRDFMLPLSFSFWVVSYCLLYVFFFLSLGGFLDAFSLFLISLYRGFCVSVAVKGISFCHCITLPLPLSLGDFLLSSLSFSIWD